MKWKVPLLAGFLLSLLFLACNIPGPAEDGTSTPTFTPTPTLTTTLTLTTDTPTLTYWPPHTPTPTPEIGGLVGATLTPIPTEQSLCPNFELELDYKQISSMPSGVTGEILSHGRVPFSADLTKNPPPLRGEGSIPITGDGSSPACTWKYSGTRDIVIGGEMVMGGQPQLHLEIKVKTTIRMIGSICSSSGDTPEMAGPFEYVFPYEDGHTLDWSWARSGHQVNAKWTLHILCQD